MIFFTWENPLLEGVDDGSQSEKPYDETRGEESDV